MNIETQTTLKDQLAIDLANYLKTSKFLDLVVENNNIDWIHTKKPSEMNYDFDYDSLVFERLQWGMEEDDYVANFIIWSLAYRIIEFKGYKNIHLNMNHLKIEGHVNTVRYNISYDPKTGKPTAKLLNADFNTEHKKEFNR